MSFSHPLNSQHRRKFPLINTRVRALCTSAQRVHTHTHTHTHMPSNYLNRLQHNMFGTGAGADLAHTQPLDKSLARTQPPSASPPDYPSEILCEYQRESLNAARSSRPRFCAAYLWSHIRANMAGRDYSSGSSRSPHPSISAAHARRNLHACV